MSVCLSVTACVSLFVYLSGCLFVRLSVRDRNCSNRQSRSSGQYAHMKSIQTGVLICGGGCAEIAAACSAPDKVVRVL